MKRRALDQITPGAFVARPVVDDAGRVLLNTGVKLTDRYLSTLADKGFKHLFVRDVVLPVEESVAPPPTPASHVAAAAAVTHAFATVHRDLGGSKEKPLAEHQQWCSMHAAEELGDAGGPLQAVAEAAAALSSDLEGGALSLGPLVQHAHERSLGEHSTRVAELCAALGEASGLKTRALYQLITGALLHDIGTAFAIGEPGPDAAVVYHTTLGFELLRASDPEDRLAPYVAYEHHEFQDGSGLPRGLVGSNRIARNRATPPVPTLVGEIAAIANAYDRVSMGATGDPLPADWALSVLQGHAGSRYNEELVRLFAREITLYPIGEDVIVESGEFAGYTAVVRAINPRHSSKPEILVYLDPDGAPCEPVTLDMLNNSSIEVRGAPY